MPFFRRCGIIIMKYYAQEDVHAARSIFAKNEDTGASRYYFKYDVGGLPAAILDVWSNSSVNPITDITTNGRVDNVYNASIELYAIPYD